MRGLRVIRKIRHMYLLLSQADSNKVNAKVFSWGFFRLYRWMSLVRFSRSPTIGVLISDSLFTYRTLNKSK